MKNVLMTGALAAAAMVLHDVGQAHGGRYVGPGDTVPPGGGGGESSAPPASGPGQPGAPPSGGPDSGPPSPGSSPGGTQTGGRSPGGRRSGNGAEMGPDLTMWDFWWGFNKEPYLNLKSKIHGRSTVTGSDDFFLGQGEAEQGLDSLRPNEAQIRNQVVPALVRVLEEERSNDMLTAAMIALAKIGDVATESGESAFVELISSFLGSGSQEVSETAAVALGILADERSMPVLVSLLKDEPAGRKLLGGKEVPDRTRAFAAYGLGLIAYRTVDNAVRQDIGEHLIDVLELSHFGTRNIKVAAMNALGLVELEWAGAEEELDEDSHRRHVADRRALALYISDYMDPKEARANNRTRHWFVRAHAPIALGRLLGGRELPQDEATAAMYRRVVETLLDTAHVHSKERRENQQSAVIAMGMLADASTRADADDWRGTLNERMRERMLEVARNAADSQAEYFALIGFAQAGGRAGSGEAGRAARPAVQRDLLTLLAKARGQKLPWSTLALGVFGRALIDGGDAVEPAVRLALRDKMRTDKTPQTAGAHAIALGLIGDQESEALLLDKLQGASGFTGSDETRGYIALGLGLMNARAAVQPIQEIAAASKYRPALLRQAAIALGLLGDHHIVPDLVAMLSDARGLSSQAAIASALGAIGDSRSVNPLVEFLGDAQESDTARAFAAVALGIVCDKEDLPWNTKFSVNANYRANTSTLTGDGKGILDIL